VEAWLKTGERETSGPFVLAVKVVWLPSAISDLERLEDFLTRDAEPNQVMFAGLVKDATRSLRGFPQRCRPR